MRKTKHILVDGNLLVCISWYAVCVLVIATPVMEAIGHGFVYTGMCWPYLKSVWQLHSPSWTSLCTLSNAAVAPVYTVVPLLLSLSGVHCFCAHTCVQVCCFALIFLVISHYLSICHSLSSSSSFSPLSPSIHPFPYLSLFPNVYHRHLSTEHVLNHKTQMQVRVQAMMVQQIEKMVRNFEEVDRKDSG